MEEKTKFCKHCGEKIAEDAILCTKCGRQVEDINKNNNQNIIRLNVLLHIVICGASCRTRTYDLTVNSRALYQLS